MGTPNDTRGARRRRVRLLPAVEDARMWVKPPEATLGTAVRLRPEGGGREWKTGTLVATVGDLWWVELVLERKDQKHGS